MLQPLTRPYPSRHGVPVITRVNTAIFSARYFTRCMSCDFCADACCQYGVDIDAQNVKRLELHAAEIEAFSGVPRAAWFTDEIEVDSEFPGGQSRRTSADEHGCVFLARQGRGCMLHGFALANGLDYHDFKPIVSALFPLTFGEGTLTLADEALDGSLVCLDVGERAYRGVRAELWYYFGAEFVAELDILEAAFLDAASKVVAPA